MEKRVFNYRLSRARRISENAFGILSSRWRILGRPIECKPENVDSIVKATVALHNYLKRTDDATIPKCRYVPSSFVDSASGDGDWRETVRADTNMLPVSRLGSYMAAHDAKNVRDKICTYFQSPEGRVPWQEHVINRGTLQRN